MNLGSLRNKQRQMHRALQSIAGPVRNLKVVTQSQERSSYAQKRIFQPPESRQSKGSRRYSRGRHLVSEQNEVRSKYRSLELGSRNRKISQPKFERDGNIYETSQNRSIRKRTSGHSIPPSQHMNDPHLMRTRRYQKKEPTKLKEMARNMMQKGQFQTTLNLLNQYEDSFKADVQYLELKGVCHLRMFKYEKALEELSRVVVYDRKNCRQAYVWCALCENQLNHPDKCEAYIDECIRLFPDHFQAYYFKGKLLFKKKNYQSAYSYLKQACALNPKKQQVALYKAECIEMMGRYDEAIKEYQKYLKDPNNKSLGFMAKLSRLLAKMNRLRESDALLQRCIQYSEAQGFSGNSQFTLLECAYLLLSGYFKQGQFEKALMKGEWILTRGRSKWSQGAIKVMMASKISQRDFYGAINISERLQLLGCKNTLGQLGQFCNGVILLMRKKALEGASELESCQQKLQICEQTQLNAPIREVIHLYLFYAYCLAARDKEALDQLKVQKTIGISPIYQKAAAYNEAIIRGFVYFNLKQYSEAYQQFLIAKQQEINKSDPLLYIAVSLFPLALQSQKKKEQLDSILNECCCCLMDCNGNFPAQAFYLRALICAWKGQWSNALMDMDYAIDKAQDNVSKFFYLRALCWACVQNYKQAIADSSIAIELNPQETESYLLRIRCLQIEGDAGLAFSDLQNFIVLRPDDKEIHKLAGHLLFENGAFEDALQAYGQGDIRSQDTEVFLTRSKTHFLLGNFAGAAVDMLEAAHSLDDSPALIFDYQMMKWLGEIFPFAPKQQGKQNFIFETTFLKQSLVKLQNIYDDGETHLGKIFKQTQFFTFSGFCYFHSGQYEAAIEKFIEVVKVKRASFMSQAEGDFEQDQGEKRMFVNQMYYNLAISYCMLKKFDKAEQALKKCKIDPELHTYQIYEELLGQIKGIQQVKASQEYLDLFSFRNKLSRFLPRSKVPFSELNTSLTNYRQMKLCIPYPKVEPPDINPTFNTNLLKTVDLSSIERRPEAPWIFKEHNSVKFTDKMQVYSKLSLGQSSVDNMRRVDLAGDSSNESINLDVDLKKQLRLDSKVELKLNKMLAKK